MAKVIKETPAEVNYTLELSQTEMNTLARIVGVTNGSTYDEKIIRSDKGKVLEYNDLHALYETFFQKKTVL